MRGASDGNHRNNARPKRSRKASRPVRRQQLIDATIVVLARKGYSALTVADVAKAAGLSVGIINFHFESKEKLLASCLAYLAEEYYRNWRRSLATPGATVAEKLQMVILGDFNDKIFTPDKLAAWIAFWGENRAAHLWRYVRLRRRARQGSGQPM